MKYGVRAMLRRFAIGAMISAPLAITMPSVPVAQGSTGMPANLDLSPGSVALADGTLVQVGDVIAHLPSTFTGCVSNDGIGVVFAPLGVRDEMGVTLDVDSLCNVVVSSIVNNVVDTVDPQGLLSVSPGAGVVPLPETPDDAVVDPGFLTSVDTSYASGVVTCKHQGWTKSTLLYYDLNWITAAESRVQSNWSSTGYDSCYGRSVTNMVVNTSSKYSYCYWNPWENTSNSACWYAVRKSAPEETWARVSGTYKTDGSSYDLNAWMYADTGSPYVGYCYLSNGTLPRNTKLDCHGKQQS